MKKMSTIILCVIVFLAVTITVAAGNRSLGEATVSESKIAVDLARIDNYFNYPVLNYNEQKYVSMRDMAESFDNYDLYWDEENRIASFKRVPDTPPKIKTPKTAQIIAEAVAKGQWKEKITENTQYCVHEETTDAEYYGLKYLVYVYFDGEDVDMEKAKGDKEYAENNADEIIEIAAESGIVNVK